MRELIGVALAAVAGFAGGVATDRQVMSGETDRAVVAEAQRDRYRAEALDWQCRFDAARRQMADPRPEPGERIHLSAPVPVP